MGDFNVNLLKYNLVTDVTEYLQNIRSAGCESFVEIPTRICIKGARCEISCLDHIYSSIAPDEVETYVIKSGISDHFATLAKVTTNPDHKNKRVCIMKRKSKLSNQEIAALKIDLQGIFNENRSTYCSKNINKKTEFIADTYQYLSDKFMPYRKLSRKEKKFHQKPWYTQGIKISVTTRDRLHRKSLRTMKEIDSVKYKKYRNLLTRIIAQSKDSYDADIIER